jgi:predicted 3-demethylubiquinone-9 3-methyltransferase (glyoxalase superfamily)
MPEITTFLTYNDQAEAAARLYISIFEGGRITSTMPGPDGKVFGLTFEIMGKSFFALNGGPTFKFSEAFSLFVSCDTQAQIDDYWAKLTADGGKESQCGWLVDKFGVSWQITPKNLSSFLGDKDRVKAGRAMAAMMKMKKFDIAALERAFEGS